jgi:hypothetical protein
MVAVEEEQFSYLVAGFKLGLVKRVEKATNPRILPQLQQWQGWCWPAILGLAQQSFKAPRLA